MKLALATAFVLALAAPALADGGATPWSAGVTDQQKADSRVLLDAGNALFLEKKYPEALDKYRAAIAIWDHPAIRFNVVRCLVLLDRPVEAAENLELALKYDAAPLEDRVYTEALAYQKLLKTQVAFVVVTCPQPGVALTLDGQAIACGSRQRVSPGVHQLVGTKQGMLTRTLRVDTRGGTEQSVAVSLEPYVRGTKVVHRWPGYVPWVVFAGGAALAAFGGVVLSSANSEIRSYDLFVKQQCTTHTCGPDELDASVRDLKASADRKNTIAATLMIGGGAAILTGAAMLYLNRGRTVYTDAPAITPSIDAVPGGGATVSVSGRF